MLTWTAPACSVVPSSTQDLVVQSHRYTRTEILSTSLYAFPIRDKDCFVSKVQCVSSRSSIASYRQEAIKRMIQCLHIPYERGRRVRLTGFTLHCLPHHSHQIPLPHDPRSSRPTQEPGRQLRKHERCLAQEQRSIDFLYQDLQETKSSKAAKPALEPSSETACLQSGVSDSERRDWKALQVLTSNRTQMAEIEEIEDGFDKGSKTDG
jgi:hypothetical protein